MINNDKTSGVSRCLPLENTYINLPKIFYTKQKPSKVPKPELVIFNDTLADEFGINKEIFKNTEGLDLLVGNKVVEGSVPIAQAYAGHQFGYFTMLGDGRAILLGEYITEDGTRFDIQLKGSGRTPYSRGGDGKAALGPMLREYIISEAMYALGIPTTRSLAVTKTGELVERDTYLDGAILVRLARSHIRVGTFEYAAHFGSPFDLKALADYTIHRHYSEGFDKEEPYRYLLSQVIKRQAELIARWQCIGFIHGVMNTDNVSIAGETIDYGPCAFMDTYDVKTVFSSIDHEGRYAYGNQPKIGAWNLARFAETLLPLIDSDSEKAVKIANEEISQYNAIYQSYWLEGMSKKLGLFYKEEQLVTKLISIMQVEKVDFTNTFVDLTVGNMPDTALYQSRDFKTWYSMWQEQLVKQGRSKQEVKQLMQQNNPVVIPRNHRVEEALNLATKNNDMSGVYRLLNAIKKPYDYSQQDEYYSTPSTSARCYKTYCGT